MIKLSILLQNKLGLHARAAAKLVQCCTRFSSQISLTYNEKTVDTTSIISIMLLAAPCGSELLFEINGSDENTAKEYIEELINNRFHEE
jgi:phosphocarrier protein HPr